MVTKRTRRVRDVALAALLGSSSLPAVADAALVKVIEYVGDHVFLTANAAEIAAWMADKFPAGRAPESSSGSTTLLGRDWSPSVASSAPASRRTVSISSRRSTPNATW